MSDRRLNWPEENFRSDHLADLDLPAIDSGRVDVLIGMEIEDAHKRLATQKSKENADGSANAVRMDSGWEDTRRHFKRTQQQDRVSLPRNQSKQLE